MPSGKFFYIKSKMNDLVLDVKGESRDSGTQVITWHQKPPGGSDNQLWYEDHITGTIKSKQSDLCLDITDNTNELIINSYDSEKENQQWMTSGDRLQNRRNNERVLDVADVNSSPGARVCAWEAHGNVNQQWTFEYQPAQFLHIKSAMHGKVLDIKKRETEPGAKAVMMDCEDPCLDNQLWYEDKHGIVCSKLTDFVLDTSDDDKVRLQPFEAGNPNQLWTIHGDRIVNRANPDMALDIKGAKTKNGAKLLAYKWHGEDNQRWSVEYV